VATFDPVNDSGSIGRLRAHLLDGQVIPACPLALDEGRNWSQRHQRALIRYYLEAGAGGLAVGVHSTQFEIREPDHALFEPVLELVSEELDAATEDGVARIAGICGRTEQALGEVETALSLKYEAALLSLGAWQADADDVILSHCLAVSREMPVIGFYLQPSVGGRRFSYQFWRAFAEIPNIVAIKIAPFNRYQTIDVVRAVIESGRDDVALYTGNDDNIVLDLLTRFEFQSRGAPVARYINGGLLGQWGLWTRSAVKMLDEIKEARGAEEIATRWLTMNIALTDANAVIFDAANGFAGCIPGILETLRRQGLVPSRRCLDGELNLSPGQADELDRVQAAYPWLNDDTFVEENLERWLR
jgi:hypothetical protein